MTILARAMPAGLCALVGLGVPYADARVEISSHPITLLNVVVNDVTDFRESAAAARALGPGLVVGVFPSGAITPVATNPRGFTVANPTSAPPRVPARMVPNPNALLGWIEPNDVNGSGVFVGQARVASAMGTVRYAFGNSNPNVPLVSGLNNPTQWAGSAATAINDRGVVVGWAQRGGTNTTEQAFYWTAVDGMKSIAIEGATSSRAESISNGGLVAGYYDKGGERRGFVFDIASGQVTDFGPVVVPTASSWFTDFRNVSVNADGVVAATHLIGSGPAAVSQAFVLDGSGNSTPILPTTGFRESFAAGISDTGWVVGMLRTGEGARQTGFLWWGGQTFDLSALDLGDNWLSIDAVYDVYSEATGDPLVQTGTIVGMGTYLEPGGMPLQRAFAMQVTLQVPEPHIYVMLAVGLLAIGALRIRRQPH